MDLTQSTAPEISASSTPDPRRWIALSILALAQLMVVLDASIVNIALPSAQKDLGISDADRQWVITAYTLAFGGLLLLGGRIADFAGRKRAFIIGLLGFAAASAIGGVAQNAVMLYGARALQGAFAALLAPAALALITVTFTEPRERAKAFGVYGAITGGGAAIGLIVGGVLTEYANWRWCLLVNIFIAIPAAIAGASIVRESRAEGEAHYDIPGAVLVSAGLVSLVYGFTEAAKEGVGWLDVTTLSFIALAVVLLTAFFLLEVRTSHPLLPMRVLLNRNRAASFAAPLLVSSGLYGMFLFLTYYFQVNLGYSALKSGFAFLPFSIGIIVTAGAVAQLLPRTGPKPLLIGGLAMAVAGMLLLLRISDTSSWTTSVLPSLLLLSIGLALFFVPVSSLALVGVRESDAGVASALLNTTQQIGGALGTALLNTLYASAVSSYLLDKLKNPADLPKLRPLAFLHGYHVAFTVGAGLLLLALLVVSFAVNARKDEVPAEGGVMG